MVVGLELICGRDSCAAPERTPFQLGDNLACAMFERSKVLRTCIYVALICYFVTKVCESVDKFQKGKISVAEEEVITVFMFI